MKLPLSLAAAILVMAPSLHAFSLDFAALVGIGLPPSITIGVGGYGNVRLSVGTNYIDSSSALDIGTAYGSAAVQLNPGDIFLVEFLSGAVETFETTIVGQEVGENIIASNNVAQTNYRIVLAAPNGTNGVGVSALNFTTAAPVPEPSAMLLGLVGAAGLIIRRRR